MRCVHCKKDIERCRMDSRGICIRDPQSSGKEKKRTRKERERDRRAGYVD